MPAGTILSYRISTIVYSSQLEMVCGKEKATSEPHNASRTRGSNFSNSSKPKPQNIDSFCAPAFQCLFETSTITSDMFFLLSRWLTWNYSMSSSSLSGSRSCVSVAFSRPSKSHPTSLLWTAVSVTVADKSVKTASL